MKKKKKPLTKPVVKVVCFNKTTSHFHVALLSPRMRKGFAYLSLLSVWTREAGEEWISRIRAMSRKELYNLLDRRGIYVR